MDAPKQRAKILIAEPDQFIQRAVRETLESAGFEAIAARNGTEALLKIQSEHPDLVLLDLMMPVKNGFEVLEEISMGESAGEIPILIFSNLSQASDIQKARDLGAADYLVKTDISMKEIVEKVREYLTKYKLKARR